ncbi:MAG: hypothetical protein K5695_07975 [Oscillospiraceae bacterium]|nr:hypothetical protein [Oscillospiraceae bacterium]
MKLLEAMYRGKVQNLSELNRWDKRYAKLLDQIVEVEERIMKISPEASELLHQYQDLHGKLDSLTAYHEFCTGFRVGAQLMAEMLEDFD